MAAAFRSTMTCLRKARVTIPQLSPTHTRAKIVQWCGTVDKNWVESYNPLFILQCSPDLITEGYRQSPDHEPLMIVETHDEGQLTLDETIQLNQWYDVGTTVGEIDDGDSDDDDNDGEWLWQAYSHGEDT